VVEDDRHLAYLLIDLLLQLADKDVDGLAH